MAITKGAKKAKRVAERRTVFNLRTKKTLKESVKEISRLIMAKSGKDIEAALPKMHQAVDKATKNHVITKNTAARIKSRFAKRVKALA